VEEVRLGWQAPSCKALNWSTIEVWTLDVTFEKFILPVCFFTNCLSSPHLKLVEACKKPVLTILFAEFF